VPGTVLERAKTAVIVAAVAVLTAALGVAASAQMARAGQAKGQIPGGAAAQQAPGPMGPGAMGRGPWLRGGPGGPGGMMGGPFGMLGPELRAAGLSDEQWKQVQAVVESHRDEQTAIAERLGAASAALHQAVSADTFDEAAIRAKAAEVAAAQADASVLRAKIRADVLALLTPEQVQKARDARGKMLQAGPRRGPGGPGRVRAPRPDPNQGQGAQESRALKPRPGASFGLPEMA